jgi:hypothetical protein
VIAGKHHYVGKETDRRWDEGEDLSPLTFVPNEFQPTGKMVAADEALLSDMAKHSLRELVRWTGLSHHTLAAIKDGKAVRQRTLATLWLPLRASERSKPTSDGQ